MIEDMALAAALGRGEPNAIRFLVDREADRLVRQCARVLGDTDAAQDVVQECFLVACRSIGSYRGTGPLAAWLSRIALRLALRSMHARRRLVPLCDEGAGSLDADPYAAAARRQEGEAIRRAVAALPEAQREVVVLHYFGELTLDEIAAATGRPSGTVRSNLHRALKRLRAELAQEAAA